MKLSTSIVVLIPALGALPCLAHPQPLSPEAFPPDYSTSTALPGPDEPYANSEPTGTASLDITPMNDTDFIPPFQERQAGLVPPPPVTTYLDVYICDGENWTGNCTHFSAPLCVPVTPDPLDECWTMHSLFEHLVTLPPNYHNNVGSMGPAPGGACVINLPHAHPLVPVGSIMYPGASQMFENTIGYNATQPLGREVIDILCTESIDGPQRKN